ncbi:ribosome maturation factor RimP [Streptomyces sp. PTM05]|uniref:Ribosome maturation factor RimP n=1 Tax=Streptantibioticus parmotrematis TaxID=2873249 RepID=A0ABS7R2U9_9ACTN|nr:ribosome maturation factor RimP [Streptantibioticus parmotrematis]MBY8888885.1 ribosome maturation factor RimP [Streptantibioticus parmotrematis]
MSTTQSDRLRGLLEPLATAAGLDLEEVAVTPAGKRRVLRVVVDSDEGVQLDAVARLSRSISEALDASDVMGGAPYVLEVGSPGTDRPLTEPRHFARNRGRLVKVRLADGGELVARIVEVDDEGMDVEVPGVKGRKPTSRRLAFAEIAKARVEVEFNRKDRDGDDALDDDAVGDGTEDEHDEHEYDEHDDADTSSAEITESPEEA